MEAVDHHAGLGNESQAVAAADAPFFGQGQRGDGSAIEEHRPPVELCRHGRFLAVDLHGDLQRVAAIVGEHAAEAADVVAGPAFR